MIDTLALAVALPLLGAIGATLWPRRSLPLSLVAGLATTAAALALTVEVALDGVQRSDFGGWGAPLGIALQADGLSVALLAMSNLVTLAATFYSAEYFGDKAVRRHFWPLWMLLWASLNGLFIAADLFNIYVALELLGLAAVALAALTGTRDAVSASLRYLLASLLGAITYLLGVTLLYGAYGTLDLGLLADAITSGPVAWGALTLMIGGLLIKTALFPMHFWLPPAHGNAPAPVSAALSALVVKVSFYLILRLWFDLFGPIVTPAAANLLGILGAAAILWGSWQAVMAERLKLMAAYSTVAQIGYLFLFFPVIASLEPSPARDDLIGAMVLFALSHGFAKAALFLAAGHIQQCAGHDRIDDLAGTVQRLPATSFVIALAGVALIGLPLSGAFTAKWLLLSGAIAAGQWWWVLVVLAGTLLAAGYIFRMLGKVFGFQETPYACITAVRSEVPALLLATTATLVLGLAANPLWFLLGFGDLR
ncbi:proton-conducting transporter membrane subunit [Thioalkalicoccus limnaeus]|uniref:Proton-conducting transporter membrane subunit n=1 Tax=Thioalkalicoccus limnaeus TaxID=120681 RepID=A0ABV4BGW1_9GAMM